MNLDDARQRLIVAFDVPDAASAFELDRQLGKEISWVKVGLELFTAEGPSIVRELVTRGRRVFLDLKLHDIPNTVAGAVRNASRLGAELLTLHAEGGPVMMRAAADARSDSRLNLLAVTVLTSLDGSEYPDVYQASIPDRVLAFTEAAVEAGMNGVVASPRELSTLVPFVPSDFLRVIPGIRPAEASTHDQARVATPRAALMAGATHLVVGRPITQAADPARAARAILEEMAGN
jgi:orotidine-5'-phosphate decarboxylase